MVLNQTYDLGVSSAMLYCLSYRDALTYHIKLNITL